MTDDESTVGASPGGGGSGPEPTSPVGLLRRVGPYELIEELGRGGMGIVYRARREDSGAVVAIKLLSVHGIDDPTLRQRFLREARAAASISHPNIARVHGILEDGPLLAIVMDYISGGTLRRRIKRRHGRDADRGPGYDVGWVIRITKQIAHGLAAAHRAGVIHRDIKPSNVLLDPTEEHAWIADFGLAAYELGDDSLTSTGHQLGTPAYMSPEQARGERVDRRSDLFSLGCLVYAMVTGESPFQAMNPLAVMRKITDYTPESLARHDHRVPPALAMLVDRLLKKDPAERYERAEDVIEALEICERDPGACPPWRPARELSATSLMPDPEGSAALEATEPDADAAEGPGRLTATSIAERTEPIAGGMKRSVSPRGRVVPRRATVAGFAIVAGLAATALVIAWPRLRPVPGPSVTGSPGPVPAVSNSAPSTAATGPAAAFPAGRRRTVSSMGPADFTSVLEAIRAAQPYDTIEVLDGAAYDGPFLIDDPYRLEGVRLVTTAGATLQAAPGHGRMAIFSIDGVRRVRVEGFRLLGGSLVHTISLRGNVAGTTLSGLQIVQPPEAQWANVLLSRECRGTADEPFRMTGCRLESWKFGIYSGRTDVADALEVSHLQADRNHFVGPATHITLMHSASEVRLEHNLFEEGRGIEIHLPSPRRSGGIAIRNNTFYSTDGWLVFGPDRADYGGVAVNNLIVDPSPWPWQDPFGPRRASWSVGHNVRESPDESRDRAVEGFGRSTSDAGLRSRDPASPDFLRPTPGGMAATGGAGPPLPGYVGARGPGP